MKPIHNVRLAAMAIAAVAMMQINSRSTVYTRSKGRINEVEYQQHIKLVNLALFKAINAINTKSTIKDMRLEVRNILTTFEGKLSEESCSVEQRALVNFISNKLVEVYDAINELLITIKVSLIQAIKRVQKDVELLDYECKGLKAELDIIREQEPLTVEQEKQADSIFRDLIKTQLERYRIETRLVKFMGILR